MQAAFAFYFSLSNFLSSDFNEDFIPEHPVANVPQTGPNRNADQHFRHDFTRPAKEAIDNGFKNFRKKIRASKFEDEVNKNAVHADNNERF